MNPRQEGCGNFAGKGRPNAEAGNPRNKYRAVICGNFQKSTGETSMVRFAWVRWILRRHSCGLPQRPLS